MSRKRISVVTPCFNEEENVEELYRQIRGVMERETAYDYEHILIDNASTDQTVAILRRIAAADRRVKVIVNMRNFGHIRSPYHGILQARGDAVIAMASDLQDPPELLPQMLRQWEAGFPVVAAIKTRSRESWWMYRLRGMYYRLITRLASVDVLEHFTGFGLYDQKVIQALRTLREPYPYFRGLISDLGFPVARIEFTQPTRKRGATKNNFYTLFDMALLGVTNHTKVPLRLATILGFCTAAFCVLAGFGYLVAKLLFWNTFNAGQAPLMIGVFFIGSVQLFFLGLVGEYVGTMFTYIQNRPLVIEKERINFDTPADDTAGAPPP
jgi:glycosyltransferase involved in cell wall biosynthesis